MIAAVEHLTEEQVGILRDAITEAVLAASPRGRDGLGSDPEPHLAMVAASRVAAEQTSRLLRQSINGARSAGQSWQTIGRLLGISRQAAQQRFGSPGGPTANAGQVGTRRVLQPLHAFNEMEVLATEGRRGWHVVDYGFLFHLVESSPRQWEHRRLWWPSRRRRLRMAEEGWQLIVPSAFDSSWAYYKRCLDTPAE